MRPPSRVILGFLSIAVMDSAIAQEQLVYIALDQPCRLLDTRTSQGGAGALTAAHGNYTFGTSDSDITSAAQHGNSTGCGLPANINAVSVTINQLNTTASGNIRAWSSAAGNAGPSAGTAVYNPSVGAPSAGQVLYNGAYSSISVGSDGRFYLSVANGQLDMTINVAGYWQSVGSGNFIETSAQAVALGVGNSAQGQAGFALGSSNTAEADNEFVAGTQNLAQGPFDIVLGSHNYAIGSNSVAIGSTNTVRDVNSVAIGYDNTNWAANTVVMGYYAYAPANAVNSFVFNDGSSNPQGGPSSPHLFWARATNGFQFYTSANMGSGAQLAAGSGSWTSLSDRNAKTAVQKIDSRDVLDRVVSMPLATWQYKTQDAKYRHMGPMAQDFYAAFGLGESDTGIDTIDADGVALAAIQGLNAKLEARDERIAELQAANVKMQAQIAALAETIGHPIAGPAH